MVQTLFNEVRRLGTEQSNNLQEIQRLRAEQLLTVPPVEPSEGVDTPPPANPAGRGIIDTRIGKPLVFSGDESTWGDWSFKLRSCVSVVDLQRGRMMEAAELAAPANTWIPSELLNQDMDAQLRYLLVMLTSGPALQIIRRYNPCSQARSLTHLQEITHFDFGQEPSGMIVFERLVGEYETSSGESLGVQVKCAVLFFFFQRETTLKRVSAKNQHNMWTRTLQFTCTALPQSPQRWSECPIGIRASWALKQGKPQLLRHCTPT